MNALQIIDKLPWELAARLGADDYFTDIPVIVADEERAKLQMARKEAVMTTQGGHQGLAVVVLQVVGDDEFPSLQFGPMTLMPAFQVIELVELNRGPNGTGKSARQVARRIRDVMKCAGFIGMVKNLQPEKPCITPVNLKADLGENVRAYQVDFRCLEVSGDLPSIVAMPTFMSMPLVMEVALACPTVGSTIYYTTDDSYPCAQNKAAQVYSGPISIPTAGITIRCCAYLQGMIASWVNRAVITATQISNQ
jgi:hypothetical protein